MRTVSPDSRRPERGIAAQIAGPIGRFRWVICTVLFLGVAKNYMDRLVIGVLKHTLQHFAPRLATASMELHP